MKVKLYCCGELIGHCQVPSLDIGVVVFMREYYVYNDKLRGYERVNGYVTPSIEYTPKEISDPEPQLPLTGALE